MVLFLWASVCADNSLISNTSAFLQKGSEIGSIAHHGQGAACLWGGAQTQLIFGGLCITHYIISVLMDTLINYLPVCKTYSLNIHINTLNSLSLTLSDICGWECHKLLMTLCIQRCINLPVMHLVCWWKFKYLQLFFPLPSIHCPFSLFPFLHP